jgi:hypothetical protein
MAKITLREVAFSRCGDKDDAAIISVIPYNEADYELVRDQVTIDRVRELFGKEVKGMIERYEYKKLKALSFVLNEALDGGTSRSLMQDTQGKAWASLMMMMEIER